MELLTKTEVNQKIGKASFWMPKRIVGLCEYVGGVEEVDEKRDSQTLVKTVPANFEKHPNGLQLSFMVGFKLKRICIHNDEIESITLESGNIIDNKERSVIGRAVVGGVLLGPLGAVVGGLSGMKDKIIKDDDVLMITSKKSGDIILKINKGKTSQVVKFFKKFYPEKLSI